MTTDTDSSRLADAATLPAVEAEGVSKRYRPREPASIVPVPWILGRYIRPAMKERNAPVIPADIEDDDLDDDGLDDEDLLEDEGPQTDRDVWALRDISFKLEPGHVLGVVGENASGKSTLIRVLSRLTPPTEGTATVRGRVAPAMPVAAVFIDRYRSGVQNVFQVARFFEIPHAVAEAAVEPIREFTELGGALEMPAKTYSSGQLQRLAYALSLYLEPDVLLLDEITTVGDPAFRERCFELLRERIEQGLTVVLATHSTKLVRTLCTDALWLKEGRIEARGKPEEVLAGYEAQLASRAIDRGRERGEGPIAASVPDDAEVAFEWAGVYDMEGNQTELLSSADDALLEIAFELREAPKRVRCVVLIAEDGEPRVRLAQPTLFDADAAGVYAASVHIPQGTLPAGSCEARAAIVEATDGGRQTLGRVDFRFEVVPAGVAQEREPAGLASPRLAWDVVRIDQPLPHV